MEVNFKPSFIRQFKKLDPELQKEALFKIELFKDKGNHQVLEVHKLTGKLSGSFGFSINYKDRIIFDYISSDEVVLLAVGDHGVYKK